MDESFQREKRIRQSDLFRHIVKNGKMFRGRILNLWVYLGPQTGKAAAGGPPALGLIVSRKTDLRAAHRNLWKRRIREAFRRHQQKIKIPAALVIQAKKQAKIPSYGEIEAEFLSLIERAGIFDGS